MKSQNEKILGFLKEHKTITQRDAIKLGCYRLSARIHDLRDMGEPITCEMIKVKNSDGSHSFIGQYRLEAIE